MTHSEQSKSIISGADLAAELLEDALDDAGVLHFFLIHFLCMVLFFATGHTMAQAAGGMMLFRPNDFGFSLGVVYLIWIAVVAALYPLCKRYSIYKSTHDHWWLSYL